LYQRPVSPAATAARITTAHGGTRQTTSRPSAATASAKSADLAIALVQTGVYSAASRMPTTEALMPRIAAATAGQPRRAPQNGSAAVTSRNDGANIAISATTAPSTPLGGCARAAPRNAENVS